MDVITISKYNDVFMYIDTERGIANELSDAFSFLIANAKFNPKVRNGIWDGRIRLFNKKTNLMYIGLLSKVFKFAELRNYKIKVLDDLDINLDYSVTEATEFFNSLKSGLEKRDYQLKAFTACIRENRSLIVSPTGSGKSFIIHMLLQYYRKKSLIIVPTTGLVDQMYTDLISYGANEKLLHKISGKEKSTTKPITITTWQAIYKEGRKFFEDFDVVIGDECHLFQAKSLIGIMEKLESCKYRFGFTGSLDGSVTHEWVLAGLFGSVSQFTKTKDLIKENYLSDFKIQCIVLNHPKEMCYKRTYPEEMDYLVSLPKRNKFIEKLVLSLEGNTLVLFQYVEKHGTLLYDNFSLSDTKKNIAFVHGGVASSDRNKIREFTENNDDVIIIASYGTFSTGVNIRNLHNVVFASPSKSRIRNLQSIGRVLRTNDKKDIAVLYDIADNLTKKNQENYTLRHFTERLKIYIGEEFDYKIYKVNL
jgi:superfamily II DNA or RNA helicase